ncbi:unnamed protein product [Didymodactylos carnosus]|uniref:Uncharacterized protein n=1 Tax=Didymodactylos carnosus TaxID=1234261 RepID=A0A815PRS0_9BILA|nr:unnamed protein product [Didymodactylos carnosus]CAF4325806.1 unnamed protein product [Didymodactylos carnosus]
MKLIIVCSLFIILALLNLSTARTIREINNDDNDDSEFLDAADEPQGNLYSRSLSDTAFQIHSKSPTIKRRTIEDNDTVPFIKNIRTWGSSWGHLAENDEQNRAWSKTKTVVQIIRNFLRAKY